MIPSRILTPYERTQLQKYNRTEAELLAAGEIPVEYLTGSVQFRDLELFVTPDTLVPRVETEGLVDHVLPLLLAAATALDSGESLHFADVGTGCGAIAISLARELSKRHIAYHCSASDISEAAIVVAQKNAKKLLTHEEQIAIDFFVSDLLGAFPVTKTFHGLIANLPYIPSARIATLEASVKDYEPHLALDGGEDGLELIAAFLDQAPTFLAPKGWVFLEVDYTHTADAFRTRSPGWKVHTFVDEFLRQRFALLTLA